MPNVVITGPSGAGKTTLTKLLLLYLTNYNLCVGYTTRAPRHGEINGRDYFFIQPREFEEKMANDELVAVTQYVGNLYGIPKNALYRDNQIFVVDREGAESIKRIVEANTCENPNIREPIHPKTYFVCLYADNRILMNRIIRRKHKNNLDRREIEEIIGRVIENEKDMDFYKSFPFDEIIKTNNGLAAMWKLKKFFKIIAQ